MPRTALEFLGSRLGLSGIFRTITTRSSVCSRFVRFKLQMETRRVRGKSQNKRRRRKRARPSLRVTGDKKMAKKTGRSHVRRARGAKNSGKQKRVAESLPRERRDRAERLVRASESLRGQIFARRRFESRSETRAPLVPPRLWPLVTRLHFLSVSRL